MISSQIQAIKRASESKKRKKKEEATTSRLRQNRQSKLIVKQEVVTSEYDDTDTDYVEFLKTYDPEKEYSDSDESLMTGIYMAC
ncbi:hypothetical protein QL285_081750 [Trifolium repens]|nr:hypothetical protein QL285_081750 [Trifolium repens]